MKKWQIEELKNLYDLPFAKLIYLALRTHKKNFDAGEIELCTVMSIKTGTCPEDCAYCPQSGHYQTGVKREALLSLETIIAAAKLAQQNGAVRFCMGAAWRSPPKKSLPLLVAIIKAIKDLGLETCMTLGMLKREEVTVLEEAGLDFYNHNLDTSSNFYKKIISTHTYDDRLQTLRYIAQSKIRICCGGILGMGEKVEDRLELLLQLSKLTRTPESIPINLLIPIPGTPLANTKPLDNFEFIRIIALTRIMFPKAMIRLSAGRASMSQEMQALCFIAGANSMWTGDKLLTADNARHYDDENLLGKLNMQRKLAHA